MPMTFDQATVDGTGAFLVHELERLDQTLNLPLVNFTWSRDIQLREDVSIADEISSFTNTTFAAAGTPNANGKNWLSKIPTALAGVNVDIAKTGFPLTLWGMELGWTVPEPVSYTHLRAHETRHDLVCRLLLEKKKKNKENKIPDSYTEGKNVRQ